MVHNLPEMGRFNLMSNETAIREAKEISMSENVSTNEREDPFNLARFVRAQGNDYVKALSELRNGKKCSHWMWYIFPQIAGIGYSTTSKMYAIQSLEEAQSYLHHQVLGPRLRECTEAVLSVEERSALEIFDSPDDMKLQSCMTLFTYAAGEDGIFARLLEKYFGGEQDRKTVRILNSQKRKL